MTTFLIYVVIKRYINCLGTSNFLPLRLLLLYTHDEYFKIFSINIIYLCYVIIYPILYST